ncbi:MAG: type II toxin-antitoxin system HipA family toxin [Planctomycetota bacterium]
MTKVRDHREVDLATVYKAGLPAAELRRDRTGIAFAYLPNYRGPAVATTLPIQPEPLHLVGGALPPFFSGLLPEGRRLSAIRQATKTSADDELSLLLSIGSDTVGDVQVLPHDADAHAEPTAATPHGTPRTELAAADFHELFARAIGPDLEDRAAIAGAQDKVSGRMISLPLAHAGADWILKLDPPEFPHLVHNEAFFLEAARSSGLETADAKIVHDRTGQPGLLVRRFDRTAAHSRAQEDACQVLGRYPADKYRLTTEEVIQGLAANTGAPIVAARTLLQQFAFAFLSCNGDAHGKNFSILHDGQEWRIAPAYDLPSTQIYRDNTMALSLAGKDREDIGRTDFLKLGEACGVSSKATARVLDQLVASAAGWIARLGELPFDARRVHKLERACSYRVERLRG